MKIYSWNINGIRAAQKKGFNEWLEKSGADIVCVQEVKAQAEQENEISVPEGYRFLQCCAKRKGYSGTGMFIRTGVSLLDEAAFSCGMRDEGFNEEGRVARLDTKDFILFCVYFPNGGRDEERRAYKNAFNDSLREELSELARDGKNVIVCGDVNIAHSPIDIKNPRSHEKASGFLPEERRYIDSLIKAGYVDTFRALHPDERRYSWWSMQFRGRKAGAGMRIDYFFITNSLLRHLKAAEVLDQDGINEGSTDVSDHAPVMIDLEF